MPGSPVRGVVGILLAAGSATRFGGNKLLAPLAGKGTSRDDDRVGVTACRRLLAAVPHVVAVVRPADDALADALAAAGAQVVRCPDAAEGMGASLACGVRAVADAAGWLVALADMPWIESATIGRVAAALVAGAPVAAPYFRGARGHPVGFGADCYPELAALGGDTGAKDVVAARAAQVLRIDVDDPGILRDVDTPADLRGETPGF